MSWTDPVETDFQSGDVPTQAQILASILDNLTHLGRGARVNNSVAQSIANATLTALAFDSEVYDPDGFHSTVTNPSRLTVPSGAAGRYLIGGCAQWASGPTSASIQIRLNGSTAIVAATYPNDTVMNVETVYDLAVGDYVEVLVSQNTGGALNIGAVSAYTPHFWINGLGGT